MVRITNKKSHFSLVPLMWFAVVMSFALLPVSIVHAQDPVRLRTVFGDIFVNLDPDNAPATVANFLDYLANGDYEDTFFHQSTRVGRVLRRYLLPADFVGPKAAQRA